MHFHLPKPLHGWREFAGEVGIIVVGVLIALLAEQAVDSLHWAAKARTAKAELHKQVVLAWVFGEEREAREDCADKFLGALASKIVNSPAQWQPIAANYCGTKHSRVYSVPSRPWPTEVWRAVEMEGTVSHLGGSYPRQASFLFDFIKSMGDENSTETNEAATLNALSYPITLDPGSRIEFIKSIEGLKFHNYMLALESRQMHGLIDKLGETPSAQELSATRQTVPFLQEPTLPSR